MSSETQGIQQLLAAERKAAEKVADARKRKAKRMKQAREEANKEVEEYRKKREEEYFQFRKKMLGNRESIVNKLQAETNQKLEEMRTNFYERKDALVEEIMAIVCDIKPEIHANIAALTRK